MRVRPLGLYRQCLLEPRRTTAVLLYQESNPPEVRAHWRGEVSGAICIRTWALSSRYYCTPRPARPRRERVSRYLQRSLSTSRLCLVRLPLFRCVPEPWPRSCSIPTNQACSPGSLGRYHIYQLPSRLVASLGPQCEWGRLPIVRSPRCLARAGASIILEYTVSPRVSYRVDRTILLLLS